MSTKIISMPQIRRTGRAAAGTAAIAAGNIFILGPMLLKSDMSPGAKVGTALAVTIGIPLLGAYLSKPYPVAGPAIAGAGLGAVITGFAAAISGDYSLAAMNPEQAKKIEAMQAQLSDLEDFPTGLGLALTGGV
jgi:hypothetical protein